MERTDPVGVSLEQISMRASERRLAITALVASGGKREWPGVGSIRICLARNAALAAALSKDGGRFEAAMELYVG